MGNCFALDFKDLNINWSFKSYDLDFTTIFELRKLGEYVEERSKKVEVSKLELVKILGVNNKIGIFDAYEEKGSNIKQKYKFIEKGDFAYNPYRVNVGSIGYVKEHIKGNYISPAYVVFKLLEEKGLNKDYLFLLLTSDFYNSTLRQFTTGSVRQILGIDSLVQLPIPIPFSDDIEKSLQTQQQIVENYYSKKNLIKELEEENIQKEQEIEDYLIKELGIEINVEVFLKSKSLDFKDLLNRWDFRNKKFTFEYKKFHPITLKEIAEFNPSTIIDEGEEISFLPMENLLLNGNIIEDKITTYSKDKFSSYNNFKKGDILYATITPSLENGKVVIAEISNTFGVGTTELFIIRIKNKITRNLVYNFFKLEIIREFAENEMIGTTGRKRIPSNSLKNLEIPLPPHEIQKKIVNYINSIRNQIEENSKKIEELKQLAEIELEKAIVKGEVENG